MEDWLIYLLRNELIAFICFEVAAFRDATKEMDKKFRGDDTYGSYFRHKENWHLETTGIWVRLLVVFAIVLGDWKVLLNALRMLNLDFGYYIYKWFINPAKTFLPETLNWFITDWKSKFNPFKLFGKDFSRSEFNWTVAVANVVTISLIMFLYHRGF